MDSIRQSGEWINSKCELRNIIQYEHLYQCTVWYYPFIWHSNYVIYQVIFLDIILYACEKNIQHI